MLTNYSLSTINRLVGKIKPILADYGPDTRGAVIADLFAGFIAEHRGPRTEELREDIIKLWMEMVRDLVAIYDDKIC